MNRYLNLGGNSNVIGYEIYGDTIEIMFGDQSIYGYSYESAGKHNVEQMKTLALSGKGLNSYIMRVCKDSWAYKKRK